MVRRRVQRTIGSEAALARRIRHERERRQWSRAGLAERMTKAGCPMDQSMVWKVEAQNPPRRITVDEAVAFADVFELELAEVLMPIELAESEEAREIYGQVQLLEEQIRAHREAIGSRHRRLAELVGREHVDAVLAELAGGSPELDLEMYLERSSQEAQARFRAKYPQGITGPGPWDDTGREDA